MSGNRGAAPVWDDLRVFLAVARTGTLCGAAGKLRLRLAPGSRRIERRVPEAVGADPIGPQLAAWMERMHALPIVQRTWPPHWKP